MKEINLNGLADGWKVTRDHTPGWIRTSLLVRTVDH